MIKTRFYWKPAWQWRPIVGLNIRTAALLKQKNNTYKESVLEGYKKARMVINFKFDNTDLKSVSISSKTRLNFYKIIVHGSKLT